jgi:hypothetical protein
MLVMWLALVLAQAPLVLETPCDGFRVRFTSASGAPTEDDGVVDVLVGDVALRLPLKPAMFTTIDAASMEKGVRCKTGLLAWEVKPGLVLLVVPRSGRPSLDVVSLALVDLRRRKVLDAKDTTFEIASGRSERGGEVRFQLVSRGAKNGLDLRVVRERLPDDGPTGAIEDWLAIRVQGDRLSTSWLRP